MKTKIIIAIVAIIVGIQFITIDKTNPPINENKDFLNVVNAPDDMRAMVKNACYDCHSHETKYPWYSNVAPVSWLLKNHINDGRRHLNFSIWPDYKEAKQDHKLEECIEMIQSGEMPMQGYVMFHPEAELSDQQKTNMIEWFRSLKK